jgi:hypothetical protein
VRRRTAAILARYSERAREAIWQAWLRHPDDERWELLTRYRGEQALASTALAAVTDPARAATARSAIGAFCVRRGIVPAGDAERALFYLMAGQPEQHRAADPDGTALAAAYQAAAEPVRAALRAAMADSGGLDLVRVVATRDGDKGNSEAEREYLAAELARRRDWPRLWRLALDLPLAEAAAAVRRLPVDWRPADEAGRQLLARLAAASQAEIEGLFAPKVVRLLTQRRVFPTGCIFAPDGSAVAVRVWDSDTRPSLTLYALPSGHREAEFRDSARLGHDEVTVFDGGMAYLRRQGRSYEASLVRYVRGHGTEEFTVSDVRFAYSPLPRSRRMAAVSGGFIVVTASGRLLLGTVDPGSGPRDVTPPGLNLYDATRVVSEPQSGRIAIVIRRHPYTSDDLLILGPDFKVIGQATVRETIGADISWVGFCCPDRLITRHGPTRLRSWRVGPPMVVEAATELRAEQRIYLPHIVQSLPSAGLIMVESLGREYLNAGTLRPTACPAALAWAPPHDGHLFLSPDGGGAALWRSWREQGSYKGEIEVRDLVREEISELVRRPLARFRVADLAAVTDLTGRAGDRPVSAALSLLRACLERRFGADVAVGDQPPAPSADDIAISPSGLG